MTDFYSLYVSIFGRKRFEKLNHRLFMLGLRGLGILNYKGDSSGESWFIRKYIATGKPIVVFDVGAHEGSYAQEILQNCDHAELFAFEPHPLNYAKLAKLPRVKAFNFAMGSKKSTLKLFDYAGSADGSQHASIFQDVIESIHHGQSTAHEIECIRLDEFCREHGVNSIDFLKVDTEGNDLEVLRGAGSLITECKIKIIQFEFNEMNVVSRAYMRDFFELLSGYSLFRLLPSGLLQIGYSPLSCELFAYQNIVAVSKSIQLRRVKRRFGKIVAR